MPANLDELLQQALTLPDDSRLFLAEKLVASVSTHDQSEDALVEGRRAEFRSGAAVLIPAEEALRQVREELAAQERA